MHRIVAVALASSALGQLSLPTVTHANTLACGAAIVDDVTLQDSLTGCQTGLVVGADGVTIDLNGHSIEGVGEGVGVEISERRDVTVVNGAVRGFRTGVLVEKSLGSRVSQLDISEATRGVIVRSSARGFVPEATQPFANVVSDNLIAGTTGSAIVVIESDWLRATRNKIVEPRGSGIDALATNSLALERNSVAGAGNGIQIVFSNRPHVMRNVANDNHGSGIVFFRSSAVLPVDENVANGNARQGIWSIDSHGRYLGNLTNANSGVGLLIEDTIRDHGPFFEVAGHLANANGQEGIRVLSGVIDGGQNRAKANGGDVQCVNIACR